VSRFITGPDRSRTKPKAPSARFTPQQEAYPSPTRRSCN
jgi:hypothetical protein